MIPGLKLGRGFSLIPADNLFFLDFGLGLNPQSEFCNPHSE